MFLFFSSEVAFCRISFFWISLSQHQSGISVLALCMGSLNQSPKAPVSWRPVPFGASALDAAKVRVGGDDDYEGSRDRLTIFSEGKALSAEQRPTKSPLGASA